MDSGSQVVNFIALLHTFKVFLRGKSTFCFFCKHISIKLEGQDNLYSLEKKKPTQPDVFISFKFTDVSVMYLNKKALHILDICLIVSDAVRMWKRLNIVQYYQVLKRKSETEVIYLFFLLLSPNAWNEGMTKNKLCYKNGVIISTKAAQNIFQFEPKAVALKNLFS